MTSLRPHPALIVALAFTASLATAAAVDAQPSPASHEPLRLVVRAPAAAIDPEALRQAIAEELAIPVELAAAPDPGRLAIDVEALGDGVMHVEVRGPTVVAAAREVDMRATPAADAVATLALLAANLLRDEASELLRDGTAARPTAPRQHAPGGCAAWRGRRTWIGADFAPYLGSSSFEGSDVERAFSFNLLGGITGSVRGFELGGGLNIATRALCGAQLSWGANWVEGAVTGAQVGALNLGAGAVTGVQLGFVDIAADGFDGSQVGAVNIAAKRSVGLQLGQLNIAAGGLDGSQVGLVNITDQRVAGAMVGLLNVAQDADAAIGLLTILTHGRTQLDLWATDAGLLMLGIEHGGKRVHNIYALGIGRRDRLGAVFAGALGLGVRVFETQRLLLDIDALSISLLAHDSQRDRFAWGTIVQLRVPFAVRLTPGVALFVAPTLNLSIADAGEPLADPALYTSTRISGAAAGTTLRMWPGLSAGLRLF